MSDHKFGDLYVGDDAALLANRLDDIDGRLYNVVELLERIAVALEPSPRTYSELQPVDAVPPLRVTPRGVR